MSDRLLSSVVVLCFAVLVGYFTYRVLNPLSVAEHHLGGDVSAFAWPESEDETDAPPRVIYLRGTFA